MEKQNPFFLQDNAGDPALAGKPRWAYPYGSGSQSEHSIRFNFPPRWRSLWHKWWAPDKPVSRDLSWAEHKHNYCVAKSIFSLGTLYFSFDFKS